MRITRLVFLMVPVALSSQSYFTENFTIEDGLPSNEVRSVFKDSRQIMWIGTAAGLCRFNGNEFIVYNSSDGLDAENIYDITEDNQGNLWIGAMAGGISKFDGKTFTNYSIADGLVCNDVRRVWWSKKFNLLLIGTNEGCSVFDSNMFYTLTAKDVKKTDGTYFVLGFLEKEDFIELYGYSFDHVFNYYPATHQFSDAPSAVKSLNSPSCSPIILTRGDTIWGWGRSGVRVWNHGLKKSFDSLGQVFHMAVDDEQNVWIAGWAEFPAGPEMPGGFYRYEGGNVIRLSDKTGITDPRVWTVFYDSVFHVIWVGTLHQGLFRMPYPWFEWYKPSYFGLSTMKVNDIYADKHNNLWIATSREIIRKNVTKGCYIYPNQEIKLAQKDVMIKSFPQLRAHQIDRDGSFEKYEKMIADGKFPYPNPYHVIKSDLGSDHIAQPGSLYDPTSYSREFNTLTKHTDDTSSVCYFAIGEDSRNNIYISGGFGLNRFTQKDYKKTPEIISVTPNTWVFAFDESDTLFGSSYWDQGIWRCAIFPDLQFPNQCYYSNKWDNAPLSPIRMISRGNEIWCASLKGGIYLTMDGENYAFCESDTSLPRSINDICFDGPENIIAGANNGEVLVLRFEGDKLKLLFRLNDKDGIVGNTIRWVQTDQKRNLYVGSNVGLNLIDLKRLFSTGKADVKFFSNETGFYDRNGKRAVIDTSGDLWIAGERNLCRLNTDRIFNKLVHKTKLVLTGLEINHISSDQVRDDKMNRWFNFPEEAVDFSHDQNNLVFYFDALNYLNPDQQRFRYRLIPAIKSWTDYSTDRKAVFTTLQSGHYTLEIEAINLLDQSQVSQLTYRFTILPPFYLTWWFILTVMFSLTSITVIAVYIRTQQIRRQEILKADIRIEMNNIEMKALKAQMNPHFIFNAINSIQSYILSNNVDKALYYLSRFAKLVRKTLENSSKEVIPLHEELIYLNFYLELEQMRFEGEFTSETDIDPQLPLQTTLIPPMIIQPFIENAIKHGLLMLEKPGHLKIEVRKLNETKYQFVIEDNGIGRKRAGELKNNGSQAYKSKGLELTNNRIQLLNENSQTGQFLITTIDLFDDKGNPAGTRVEVTLPL